MDVKIIAAVSIDGAIGNDKKMLWHVPEDFKRYKERTTGNILIVGRKTYDTLPYEALKNRTHIVIKSKYIDVPPNCDIYSASSLENALKQADEIRSEGQEVFIISGSEVYKQAINICSEAEITWINKTYPDANKKFPIDELFNNFDITGDSNWVKSKKETLYKFTYYKKND